MNIPPSGRGRAAAIVFSAACALVALGAPGTVQAGPIGQPWYSIELAAWDENFDTPPGAYKILTSPDDAVAGSMAGGIPLGAYVLGPAQADLSAVVLNDGQTFWADASTPLYTTLPRTPGSLIGGTATVDIVQSYRKASADASLSFTYSSAFLEVYRDVELPSACDGCIRAEVGWTAEVSLNSDPGTVLWSQTQYASLWDDGGTLTLDVVGQSTHAPVNPLWQWDCDRCNGPARGLGQATLEGPYTGIVDLSGIAFDASLPPEAQPEFTVHYTLTAIAFDEGLYSGARAFARDPLGGSDDGVSFTIDGLLPTDRPVGVVPEPASWAMSLAGLALLTLLLRRHGRM